MSSDFLKVMLADLCTDVSYGYTASSISEPVGPKFLRITDIQGGAVDWASVPYCEASESAKRKNKLERGDIVIARTGNSTGENYIFESNEDTVFASYLIRFRVNPALANPYFVWLQLRTQAWWDYVSGSKSGSAQAGANAKVLGCYELNLPDRKVQNKIELIFRKLNEKIQVNQQISQTLEQMAQAIFKSWFVDFEPVKAKIAALEAGGSEDDALLAAMQAIAGSALFAIDAADADAPTQLARLQAEHPEQYATLRATAELFPSAMQESELGEIPEGWEAKRVGKYLDTISKTYPLKKVKEVVFLNTGDIKEGRFLHANKSLTEGLPGQAKKSIKKHDILYSEIRPQNKRYAYVDFEADDYVVSTKLMVLRSSGEVDSRFLYFLLTQKDSIDYLQMMAESRSGTFPQITFDVLEKINFLGPVDNKLLNYFAKFFLLPFMNNSFEIVQQNKNLEELRDTLLPKLLSGELSLAAAEEQLADAVEPAHV